MADPDPSAVDAANLAGPLRREPSICAGCISGKLALTMQGVLEAALAKAA